MKSKMIKYFSMFSGVGGFEIGIQRACFKNEEQEGEGVGVEKGLCGEQFNECSNGFSCVGFSEVDKYAVSVYRKHFPNHKNYGDATKINPDKLPDFQMLCGGFLCQSFSIAGKRLGFEDTRGTLFFDIARIIKRKKPQIVFLENVKGLLSHDNGKTFATILATFDELGYNVEWQVLNSKHYGVPQNRERVFIIGHLRGTSGLQVFPLGQDGEEFSESPVESREEGERVFNYSANTISQRDYKGGNQLIQLNKSVHSTNSLYSVDGVSRCIRANAGGKGAKTGLYITPCLDGGNGQAVEFANRIRRLTPRECERLQSFPDDWTKYGMNEKGEGVVISDTQHYKMMGNAITVNVIQKIMEQIIKSRLNDY